MLTCKLAVNQLEQKPEHGAELCVFKELLRFYTKHSSPVHNSFEDVSKAFVPVDRH